jgi:hypothetical protein
VGSSTESPSYSGERSHSAAVSTALEPDKWVRVGLLIVVTLVIAGVCWAMVAMVAVRTKQIFVAPMPTPSMETEPQNNVRLVSPTNDESSHVPMLTPPAEKEPQHNVVRSTPPTNDEPSPPVETPEVVTPDTLYRFPKLYQDQRIQLVGWEWALVQIAKSAHVEGLLIPPDCKYVLNFARPGLGCASTIPEHLLNPFGIASEEDIDLTCTVQRVTDVGSLLTHCELSPSSSRKMKDREYELETGKSPYAQPSKEDSKCADAQLPMDASKYRPIEIHTASCSQLPDTPNTVMCVSSAAVRDKGASITLDGVPARQAT